MQYLTHPKQAIRYLLERGHITSGSIVDGDVVASESSSRHRNLAITSGKNVGHFIKSIPPHLKKESWTLQREAAFYHTVQQDADLSFWPILMPRLYSFDPQRGILAIEHISDAENLAAHYRRHSSFPETVALKLGQAIGLWHSQMQKRLVDSDRRARFVSFLPNQVPWALWLHQMPSTNVPDLNAANAQMLSILQTYPEFRTTLDALRASWQPTSVIHGDMKFENCLIFTPEGAGSETKLKLIDWELVDFGDPLWDVGAILQSYLLLWANTSIKTLVPGNYFNQQHLSGPDVPLSAIQPSMRAFLDSYSDAMELDRQAADTLLERAFQYAAARLIQTVYEVNYARGQFHVSGAALLQFSLNILVKPRESMKELLHA